MFGVGVIYFHYKIHNRKLFPLHTLFRLTEYRNSQKNIGIPHFVTATYTITEID